MKITRFLLLACALVFGHSSKAQISQDSITFTVLGEYDYTETYPFLTHFNYSANFNRNGEPYIYAAAGALGLSVFDINNPALPKLDTVLPKSVFNNLNVSHLHQANGKLYAALGNFQGIFGSDAGIAILDISNPAKPIIEGIWTTSSFNSGSAVIRVVGDYAYLGIMDEGLLILKIDDPSNITQVSSYQPDPAYPAWNTLTPAGRGLTLRNDTLFLAYDSGGLRLIDVSDKANPVQIDQYADSLMWFGPPATPVTNHVLVKGASAFVTNDYCGLSSVNFQTPNNLFTQSWHNPWNCIDKDSLPSTPDTSSWFGSPGHSNEMVFINDSILLLSGGDTEIQALDITNPNNLRLMGHHTALNDSQVVWGIDYFNGKVALAYVRNPWQFPFPQPYLGNWGGIKILEVNKLVGQEEDLEILTKLEIYPNPAVEIIRIKIPDRIKGEAKISIIDLRGNEVDSFSFNQNDLSMREIEYSATKLPKGLYLIRLEANSEVFIEKFILKNAD